ncbi:MAG: SDR family oxidoreductase [Rhodospirillaceae bacterium]|nr:SDR family oxidoreductase [Rhodospirillaceae bacterium]
MPVDVRLDGQVALVTGGGAGIGRAIVGAFAELGATVIVAENNPAHVESLQKEFGGKHLISQTDVTEEAAVAALFARVKKEIGRLDILINNVGHHLSARAPFENTTTSVWDALYRVNLLHVFLMTQAAIPLIRAGGRGGSIVNLSTIEAFRGIPGLSVYSAFKAAITGYTRSMALELGPDNIRVNAIASETTESEQVKALARVPPEQRDHISRWFPIGRFGTPEDSAGAAVYLASNLSRWVTGTTIHVDGGALAAGGFYRTPQNKWTHFPIISDET